MDASIAKLRAGLPGPPEQVLTVATADHGESLGEHGEAAHGFFVYDATILVPLVLHWPGRIASREGGEHPRLIDLAPTILDLLGLPPLPSVDGVSLRPLTEGRAQEIPPALRRDDAALDLVRLVPVEGPANVRAQAGRGAAGRAVRSRRRSARDAERARGTRGGRVLPAAWHREGRGAARGGQPGRRRSRGHGAPAQPRLRRGECAARPADRCSGRSQGPAQGEGAVQPGRGALARHDSTKRSCASSPRWPWIRGTATRRCGRGWRTSRRTTWPERCPGSRRRCAPTRSRRKRGTRWPTP